MTPREQNELTDIALRAAEEAAPLILEAFGRPRGGELQKGRIDLVTETDRAVEACLRRRLRTETSFAFVGEEEGRSGDADAPWQWVVDPIDGTTNFAHRIPHLAISIGLWGPEGAALGVILNPVTGECFRCDGSTVQLGGRPLPALEDRPLAVSVLATGFPYDRQTNPDNNVAECDALLMKTRGVRRFGAAALDLAWLAAGRIDGFWEPGLKPWDVVAGLAMIRALGGVATNYAGAPWTPSDDTLIAGHPHMVARLRAEIGEVRAERLGEGLRARRAGGDGTA